MLWLFVIMLVLFAISTPIAWSMAIAAAIYMVFGPGIPLQGLVQRMIGGIDTFPLLAIPFFILAGNLMNTGGITDRLVRFAKALVGHIRGGLAHVVVVTNMIMAGMSGSGVADAAGSGTVLIPAMRRVGYGVPFAAAIVASAGTIGPIIPPSIPMIIYAMSVESVSIGGLFLSGIVPGILMGLGMMAIAYVQAVRYGFPASGERFTKKTFLPALIKVLPALFMPVLILGGILGGIFTATEAAAVGVLYALCIGLFVTRKLKWNDFWSALLQSGKISSMVFMVIATAMAVGWMLTEAQMPQFISAKIKAISANPLVFLLLLNIFLLLVGCVLEPASAMVMLMPIISPIATAYGIHSLHLGIVVVLNLTIGLLTPPVGTCLFVACGIAKLPMEKVLRTMWPHLAWQICVLFLITYVPSVALTIPFWFGMK
jgi:tripartite ATP-independent transporter DctM subunit